MTQVHSVYEMCIRDRWWAEDLQNLIEQLPSPLFLVGDFKAHSPTCDCLRTKSARLRTKDLLTNNALVFSNTGESTHFNVWSGTLSAIDLAPRLETAPAYSLERSLPCADYNANAKERIRTPKRWWGDHADWTGFKTACLLYTSAISCNTL